MAELTVALDVLPAALDANSSPGNAIDENVEDAQTNGEGLNDEGDSSLENDSGSCITSLDSEMTNFKLENGRRYHVFRHDRYFLPNDVHEQERLNLFHNMLKLRLEGKLHLAPIKVPQRVLDLGTGTGIWAIEMGDKYPSAEVIGNDLSPIQPSMVPPNVRFEVDDFEEEWLYSGKFDYIHGRYLAGSILDWPRLISQAFEFLKPGGWVEFQECDMKFSSPDETFVSGSPLDMWKKEIAERLTMSNKEPEPGPKLENWVQEAGFQNIKQKVLPIPIGRWPRHKSLKDIGAYNRRVFLDGLEAISLRALTKWGRCWSYNEVLVYLTSVRKNLKDLSIHAQNNLYIVYAQKPVECTKDV